MRERFQNISALLVTSALKFPIFLNEVQKKLYRKVERITMTAQQRPAFLVSVLGGEFSRNLDSIFVTAIVDSDG